MLFQSCLRNSLLQPLNLSQLSLCRKQVIPPFLNRYNSISSLNPCFSGTCNARSFPQQLVIQSQSPRTSITSFPLASQLRHTSYSTHSLKHIKRKHGLGLAPRRFIRRGESLYRVYNYQDSFKRLFPKFFAAHKAYKGKSFYKGDRKRDNVLESNLAHYDKNRHLKREELAKRKIGKIASNPEQEFVLPANYIHNTPVHGFRKYTLKQESKLRRRAEKRVAKRKKHKR